MTLELGEYVVRGEIVNTENYSTHGYLELRGCDRPLLLQLTGNCSPDLLGRHLRFRARNSDDTRVDEPPGVEDFAWQQVGPTGEMTVARTVRIGSSRGRGRGARRPCLFLEWFSQNGRVVVELPDPLLEFVDPDDEPEPVHGEWYDDDAGRDDPFALSDGDFAEDGFGGDDAPIVDESEDDPYGLFPDDFELGFEEAAAETDRLIGGTSAADFGPVGGPVSETELLDELIEKGDGDPIGTIFEEPIRLRRPEGLTSDEVEAELKTLLQHLAIYGIAIDVCEHFSPRRVYTWLLDEILPEECAYPELRSTQWVQHFSTSDDCADCDEEFEIEFEDRDDRGSGADDFPDDDYPF